MSVMGYKLDITKRTSLISRLSRPRGLELVGAAGARGGPPQRSRDGGRLRPGACRRRRITGIWEARAQCYDF
jgi:hypothetical protein